jgi:hypothetical protein
LSRPDDDRLSPSDPGREEIEHTSNPVRFWLVLAVEIVFFAIVSAILLTPVIGTILEGPPAN